MTINETPAVTVQVPLKLPGVPPWAQVVLAVISVQVGAGIAKGLFDTAGPGGVVFLRTFLTGILFMAIWRPRLRLRSRSEALLLVVYGVVIAFMMLSFYAAIDRIPLGVAVAIAFTGPLALAVAGSRRVTDLLWVALAAGGVLLLSPITNAAIDPLGALIAIGSSVCWVLYILLTGRINKVFEGNTALAWSMCIAALVALPFGIGGAAAIVTHPGLIALALVVALLSSAIPFALEYRALKFLRPGTFGLLVSLEPVMAVIAGFVLLNEALGVRELAGIIMVTVAAIATARSSEKDPAAPVPVTG